MWAAPPGQPGRDMTTERGGILPYAGVRIPLTAILKKAKEALEEHPQFVRWRSAAEETE